MNDGEFIEIWNSSKSRDVVSARTGLTKRQVTDKASWLRRHGVNLKRFNNRMSRRQFIEIWESCESFAEVLRRTGYSRQWLWRKHREFLAMGIRLKKFSDMGTQYRNPSWRSLLELSEEIEQKANEQYPDAR